MQFLHILDYFDYITNFSYYYKYFNIRQFSIMHSSKWSLFNILHFINFLVWIFYNFWISRFQYQHLWINILQFLNILFCYLTVSEYYKYYILLQIFQYFTVLNMHSSIQLQFLYIHDAILMIQVRKSHPVFKILSIFLNSSEKPKDGNGKNTVYCVSIFPKR